MALIPRPLRPRTVYYLLHILQMQTIRYRTFVFAILPRPVLLLSCCSFQNVIVLDLSQENSTTGMASTTSSQANATITANTATTGNNVLSDILQMTGIMAEEDVVETSSIEQSVVTSDENDQRPGLTTTLQKGRFCHKILF